MNALRATVLTIAALATGAPGQVQIERDDTGIWLRSDQMQVHVTHEGVLSAGAAEEEAAGVVFDARPAVPGDRGGDLLAGAEVQLRSRTVEDNLGVGAAIDVIFQVPQVRVTVPVTLYEDGPFFTVGMEVQAREPYASGELVLLRGAVELGAGDCRVLRHEDRWRTVTRDLADRGDSTFSTVLCNIANGRNAVIGALSSSTPTRIRTEQRGRDAHFEARAVYHGSGSRLDVPRGQRETPAPLAVVLAANVFEGMELYADLIARHEQIQLHRPIPAGWCSWDALGWMMRQQQIYDQIDAITEAKLVEYGFNTFQIDDGWQCGWRVSGDWRPNPSRFPDGIEPIARAVDAAGMELGLWVAPFYDEDRDSSAGPSGEVVPNAPGWMQAARPVLLNNPQWMTYRGSEPSGNYDLSHPGFQQHLTDLMHTLTAEWGARYIKVDFIAYGYGIQRDRSRTEHDWYQQALRSMREGMTDDTYFMTCISHEFKSVGIADAQRLGNDVGGSWRGIFPTAMCAGGWYHYNGRIWWSDPDQLHVGGRVDDDGRLHGLSIEQARAWATFIGLYGSVTLTGDRIDQLDEQRMKLLTMTVPSFGISARPLDLFDVVHERSRERYPGVYALAVDHPAGAYHVLGVFNWTGEQQVRPVSLIDLGLAPDQPVLIYDAWSRKLAYRQRADATLRVDVEPTSCRRIVIRPYLDRPQFLASDRHILAGWPDVQELTYDVATSSLEGRSENLVAGDEFSYAFYTPPGWGIHQAGFGEHARVERIDENVSVVTFTAAGAEMNWFVRFGPR